MVIIILLINLFNCLLLQHQSRGIFLFLFFNFIKYHLVKIYIFLSIAIHWNKSKDNSLFIYAETRHFVYICNKLGLINAYLVKLRYSIIAANYAFVMCHFRAASRAAISSSLSLPPTPAASAAAAQRTSRITRLVNAFTCPSRAHKPVVVSVYPNPLESISRFGVVDCVLALTERSLASGLVLVRRAIEIDRIASLTTLVKRDV